MTSVPTSWTMIEGAARGGAAERELFARRYGPVVKAYLYSRWRSGPTVFDIDDTLQDVFLECLKCGGALERVEQRRSGGFRAFLFGITRNVAARHEEERRKGRAVEPEADPEVATPSGEEADPARVFDRAWALSTVQESLLVLSRRAQKSGAAMRRRVLLLDLRFREGLPLREIADRWGEDPAHVHKDYAQARREFESALRSVVSFDVGLESDDVTAECREVLRLLSEPA